METLLNLDIDYIDNVKKQKYIPDWNKVKCTVHLLLIYVAERTEKDKNFTFTARDIANAFSCSRNAAWMLIKKVEKFGNFKKIGTEPKVRGKPLGLYQITHIGLRYARKLAQDADEELLPVLLSL